jgi:hypothetical protein
MKKKSTAMLLLLMRYKRNTMQEALKNYSTSFYQKSQTKKKMGNQI